MPRIATQPQLAPIGSNLSATKRPTDRNASNNATHAGAANSDRFERVTSSSRAGNLDNIGGRFNTIAAGAGSRLDSLTAGLAAPTPGAGASMNVSRGTDRHNNLPTTDRAPGRDATASHSIHVDRNVASSDYNLWNAVDDCWTGAERGGQVLGGISAVAGAIAAATAASPTGPGATLAAVVGGIAGGKTGTVVGGLLGCPLGIAWGVHLANEKAEEDQAKETDAASSESATSSEGTDESESCDSELMSCEAPDADETSTPMPDADTGVGPNTLSAEELRALKERLHAEATAALTQPSGEPSHTGAPQIGTHNPMERQELNHLILNTDETASGDETGLPTFDEGPQRVDPMDATTQPPTASGEDDIV